jgi:hypothetical protein
VLIIERGIEQAETAHPEPFRNRGSSLNSKAASRSGASTPESYPRFCEHASGRHAGKSKKPVWRRR